VSDGGGADLATDLELEHLDHALNRPPADPTIEVFVRVRAGEATGPTTGQAPARFEHVPRWSQLNVPHFIQKSS
jgi:hypothetical protein